MNKVTLVWVIPMAVIALVEVVRFVLDWRRMRNTCAVCKKPNRVLRRSKLLVNYTCENNHEKRYPTVKGFLYMVQGDEGIE